MALYCSATSSGRREELVPSELTLENDFLEGALTKAGLLSVKR